MSKIGTLKEEGVTNLRDSMLTWQNDPLLLDCVPVPWQQWTTANDLITNNQSKSIPQLFLQDNTLNFYGIMVRKSDFLKHNYRARILTRFPYLTMAGELQEIVKANYYRFGGAIVEYFRGSERFTPREGYKKIDRYLNQQRLPLPFFRILATFSDDEIAFLLHFFCNSKLESFRHEPFIFPLEITEQLAYFLGACAGDGSLYPRQVRIIDGHKHYMQRLHKLAITLTETKVNLNRFQETNSWLLILKNKWFARLVHFLTGHPFGKKYESLTVPKIFQEYASQKNLENRYCQGLFDTDGTYDKRGKSVWVGTSTNTLILDVSKILKKRNIHHSVYDYDSSFWNLFVKRSGLNRYAEEIGFISPLKQIKLCKALTSEPYRLEFLGVNKSTIINETNHLNFELLPKLLITNGYSFFCKYLKQLEGKQRQELRISSNRKKAWQQSNRVPFQFLKRVTNLLEVDIYEEMEKHHKHYAYPYAKYTIRLSSIITDELIEIMAYLTPYPKGLVITTGIGRELEKRRAKDVINAAATFFEISKTSFQRNNDHSYKIANTLLRDYAKTFFIYQRPWKALSKQRISDLVVKWDKIIAN